VKRRIFNVLAGVSLLLGVGTAGLWVRGYWRWDEESVHIEPHAISFDSANGKVALV
jgi:hypothetical protein